MKPLTCGAARRRLHAFHDGELPISEQIAVAAHLDWCRSCAELLADFQVVGEALGGDLPSGALEKAAAAHETWKPVTT